MLPQTNTHLHFTELVVTKTFSDVIVKKKMRCVNGYFIDRIKIHNQLDLWPENRNWPIHIHFASNSGWSCQPMCVACSRCIQWFAIILNVKRLCEIFSAMNIAFILISWTEAPKCCNNANLCGE